MAFIGRTTSCWTNWIRCYYMLPDAVSVVKPLWNQYGIVQLRHGYRPRTFYKHILGPDDEPKFLNFSSGSSLDAWYLLCRDWRVLERSAACACARDETQPLSWWYSDLITLFVNSYLLLGDNEYGMLLAAWNVFWCNWIHTLFRIKAYRFRDTNCTWIQKSLSCGQQFRGASSVPALVTESLPAPASSVSTGQPDLPGHVHQETAMATGAYVTTRRDGQFAFPLEPAATGESRACTGVTRAGNGLWSILMFFSQSNWFLLFLA